MAPVSVERGLDRELGEIRVVVGLREVREHEPARALRDDLGDETGRQLPSTVCLITAAASAFDRCPMRPATRRLSCQG